MNLDDFKREVRHTTDEDEITKLCDEWLKSQTKQEGTRCRLSEISNGWYHNDDCLNWVWIY